MLDLGLASADRYAGVDSSQAMLNLLIRKHPKALRSTRSMSAMHSRPTCFSPGQFDWVFLDAAVELTAVQHAQVEQIARLAVIVVDGHEWTLRDVSKNSAERIRAESDSMRAAS